MSDQNSTSQESSNGRRTRTKLWEAFKTMAIIFSFTVNLVLVIVLLIIAGWIIFPVKTDVVEPLLDDLQGAVDALGQATIVRTIPIDQRVPVNFTLPLKETTVVVLSEEVKLNRKAIFRLPAGGGMINGDVELTLPKGLELPVRLELDVPVDNTIPVQFPVEVSIPLRETELNAVVVKLNEILSPVREYLDKLPDGY